MPRKVNYGVDYNDEDYDYDYEDYEYDDDDEEESITGAPQAPAPESKQVINRPKLWRCSICTYDNEESMTACDICGVLRRPLANNYTNSDKRADDGMFKDSAASQMAKSLFASSPHRTPKQSVLFQKQNDFVTEEANKFYKLGSTPGHFCELHRAYRSHSHSHIDIAPFNFDVPSPDDKVSSVIQSSKVGSKANSGESKSTKVTSSVPVNTNAIDSRMPMISTGLKSRQDSEDKGNHSKYGVVDIQSSTQSSHNSYASTTKGRHESAVEGSSSKSGRGSDSSSTLMPKGRLGSVHEGNSSSTEHKSQNLTSSMNNVSLKSGYSNKPNARGAVTHGQFKPEKWMLPDQTEDTLVQLNLAIVGHVDSGKSTLSGRLLHLLGRISQKQMHKFEKEAKIQGKGSFAYAWALDESAEERERGITMTVAVAYFDSKKYHVVILDSPGHKDFVPNMISGATQADAAILVIDASVGAFEAGLDSNKGQTKEHAQLIRSFGVDQIIVAVNKMDIVQYSKDRFDFIKQQLGAFLRPCGFKDSSILWVPLSAMENQNLVAAPSDGRLLSWYKGPYLLDAIDSFQPPTRDFSKPLLMPICDVIKLPSLGQVSACGKVEAGALRSGSKVVVMPGGDVGTVRSIERDSEGCSIARAGDNVAVCLQGIDESQIMAGGVLCHPEFPVAVAKRLELKVLVLDVSIPILFGSQVEFHVHHAKEAARVAKIVSLLDPKTGKVIKKSPRCLTAKQSAVVEVALHGPVCVEEFSNSKSLGRVFLRALGRTVAVGIITRIIEDQE